MIKPTLQSKAASLLRKVLRKPPVAPTTEPVPANPAAPIDPAVPAEPATPATPAEPK